MEKGKNFAKKYKNIFFEVGVPAFTEVSAGNTRCGDPHSRANCGVRRPLPAGRHCEIQLMRGFCVIILGTFYDLEVWNEANNLAIFICKITNSGLISMDFGLRDQIRSAAVSVPLSDFS